MLGDYVENVIEWINGDKEVTVTFSQKKYIRKIKELAERYPDEVKIIDENSDGSILAHMPLSAIHISLVHREDKR